MTLKIQQCADFGGYSQKIYIYVHKTEFLFSSHITYSRNKNEIKYSCDFGKVIIIRVTFEY